MGWNPRRAAIALTVAALNVLCSFDSYGKQSAVQLEVYPAVIPSQPAQTNRNYDPVPNEFRDSIASRLKLIEQLIRDYGRAYDYRTFTTPELQEILDKLQPKTDPAPAPTQNSSDG